MSVNVWVRDEKGKLFCSQPSLVSDCVDSLLPRTHNSQPDLFFTCNGRPLRSHLTLAQNGIRNGDTIDIHSRRRGGLDTLMIVLIVIGGILGLVALYYILPKVFSCFRWTWRRVLAPPIFFVYDYIFTPIGHCTRDCMFISKEACCDCYDRCDLCCNPYKRV